MLITTNAIVISKLKYRDNDLIIKCYTKEKGIVSFLQKGILKQKSRNSKIAYFQLLTQLQLVANIKPQRSLHYIKEVKPLQIYKSLHTNILKSSIVLFLSEILSQVLQEEETNENLYSYLENSFLWLDTTNSSSNFHLLFLLDLTKYLGFYPDTSAINLPYFNLLSGAFKNSGGDKLTISGKNLILLKQLLGINFAELNDIELNSKQRQSFLSIILLYFELHLEYFKMPKSLHVFNDIFN